MSKTEVIFTVERLVGSGWVVLARYDAEAKDTFKSIASTGSNYRVLRNGKDVTGKYRKTTKPTE